MGQEAQCGRPRCTDRRVDRIGIHVSFCVSKTCGSERKRTSRLNAEGANLARWDSLNSEKAVREREWSDVGGEGEDEKKQVDETRACKVRRGTRRRGSPR